MEINKIKDIEININKQRADIYSQDKLNLRFNNTFADPTKIQTIQTEYSFSFTLPITPTNQKIFDFADVTSKRSKFNKRYPTTVMVDGLSIFSGELLVQSITREGYKCNLYINKLNTVESIFGDSVLSDITGWKMPYDQDVTINEYNSKENIQYPQDAFFPLAAYGMFQKLPKTDETYTSKFLIDDYNRIYNENFYPSINLLKTVEKCFAHKGYTVQGDIFDDPVMKKIYMSTRLGKEQEPAYNYGDPDMGKLEVNFTYKSWDTINVPASADGRGGTAYTQATATSVQLDTPKFKVNRYTDSANWTSNNVYDIWSAKDFCTINSVTNENLWRQNRIVAPATGYYKLSFDIGFDLDTSKTFKSVWLSPPARNTTEVTETEITPTINLNNFFVEFQLVKNSEDGSDVKNIIPDCVDTVFTDTNEETPTFTIDTSLLYQYSAYPHTPKGNYTMSTESDPYPMGYIPKTGKTLAYDPSVNPNFVMGCAFGGGYAYNSVIKNGRSWDNKCPDVGVSRFGADPYQGIKVIPNPNASSGGSRRASTIKVAETATNKYGYSSLVGSSSSLTTPLNQTTGRGKCNCIVFLEKNDMIQLKMLQRRWENAEDLTVSSEGGGSGSQGRGTRAESSSAAGESDRQTDAVVHITAGTVTFEAFSPDDVGITDSYLNNYKNPSRFPTDLELGSFLSNEDKMSDFINNFIKEFNLSYSQNGKIITLNKQKVDFKTKYAVNLTDRVDEIETIAIEYPSQMSVQYTISDDERGVYISAEKNATDAQMQSNDWKDFADKGYDIIKITEDEYADEEKLSIKTSFNWFEDFKVTMNGQDSTVTIPVIAKDEWMIDGLKDAEYMKQDGLSFNRRYWFPSDLTDTELSLCNNANRQVKVKLVSNTTDGCELSYKESGKTLLTNYFNIFYDTDSNYIKFAAYLTSEEYIQIKNGANIVVDDDVYIPIQLNGYDCSGNNKTEITAMKK